MRLKFIINLDEFCYECCMDGWWKCWNKAHFFFAFYEKVLHKISNGMIVFIPYGVANDEIFFQIAYVLATVARK